METVRQTDKPTGWLSDGQTEKQRETETERDTQRTKRDRHIDRQ